MANITIPDNLFNDIQKFCELNNIESVEDYCVKLLREKYYIEKYGDLNKSSDKKQETNKKKNNKQNKKQEEKKEDKNDDEIYDVYDR